MSLLNILFYLIDYYVKHKRASKNIKVDQKKTSICALLHKILRVYDIHHMEIKKKKKGFF